jgi:prophage regulatory protein
MSASEILRRERERKQAKQIDRGARRVRRILRLHEVKQRTGLGKSQIYQGIADGTFPKSVPIGARAVGWLDDELDDWLQERITARDSGTAMRSLPGAPRVAREYRLKAKLGTERSPESDDLSIHRKPDAPAAGTRAPARSRRNRTTTGGDDVDAPT